MDRRHFLVSIAALATATPAFAVPSVQSAVHLLAKPWRHVGTNDLASGADIGSLFPHIAGNVSYRHDGSYVFGDGSDIGSWSLSDDARTLTIHSATFEYRNEFTVERLDQSGLRVSSRAIAANGVPYSVVESFVPAARSVVTAR